MWGAIASIGGGLISGLGSMLGSSSSSSGESSEYTGALKQLGIDSTKFQYQALDKYSDLYQNYYWPIEEQLAQYYKEDLEAARPYEQIMRDYQLWRGNDLIKLAFETNPTLDENKKDVIRRLTEGEDVLRDRYRTTASADVSAAYDNQRDQDMRQMNTMGINPNSGAYVNYTSTMGNNEALAQAGARTNAAWQAEDTSLQRQMEANNWYTNPSMLYNQGQIQPGMSVSNFNYGTSGGGSSYGYGSSSSSSSSGGDMWGGIGSAFGGIMGGMDRLFPEYNMSNPAGAFGSSATSST